MSVFSPPSLHNSHRWSGLRVGLLGGSFNPPHEGHLHISKAALKGLALDAVWWLVSPQNPIKADKPLPLDQRMILCNGLVDHPQILISDIEKDIGTNVTYFTVKKLKHRFPKTEFVWISGMDNARSLHEWNHWQKLLDEICMLHLTRNPAKSLVQACPLRMLNAQKHVFVEKSGQYPLNPNTTYWMMQKKIVNISSTEIRKKLKLYQ